ncbi:TetR/AcrR family transcriptional regulator [Enhygromyxa salina]|uniref:DNA-binding transcriptional repressor AcrR n=1 Tax=Enhygromyxa salina TaxID=215803 RepID=A0A2S9YR95_9BACT|nr:TetR/AcrR family transcriptional regulator [Enhygromyxa salina]PRQ07582.1 DNA-binding transcriptional repressor AcrR [Enhygromyxa salina]
MFNAEQARARLDAMVDGEVVVGSPAHRRRMLILAAATELFVAQGYKKTGVAEIARRAGVTKPTLYANYASKAQLLLHAIANEKRAYFDRVSLWLDVTLRPRERLRCLIEQSLLLAHQMPLTSRMIRGEHDILLALTELDEVREFAGSEGARSQALRSSFHEELLEMFAADVLTPEQRSDRAKVIVALSFCAGVLAEPDIRQDLPYERVAALLATMLAAGVDTPEPDPS